MIRITARGARVTALRNTLGASDSGRHPDLSFGTDARGDRAFFLRGHHLLAPRKPTHFARLDGAAALRAGPGIVFFRLIDDVGRERHAHGFIEDGGVVQWG